MPSESVAASSTVETVVPLIMLVLFCVIGFFLTTNRAFAEWGLRHGKGRIWVRLLGQERATKFTQRVLGPLLLALGGFGLLAFGAAVLGK